MKDNQKVNHTENEADNDDSLYQLKLNKSEDNIKLVVDQEETDSMLDEDKDKLIENEPNIKKIESEKIQGPNFPGIKKEKSLRKGPLKYSYKFKIDP